MDGVDEALEGTVALLDEARVQTDLRAVGVAAVVLAVVEGAEGVGIAAAMLIVTLIGSDEGEGGHVAAGEVGEQATGSIEGGNIVQAVVCVVAILDCAEVGEGIVLDGIELDDAGAGRTFRSLRQDGSDGTSARFTRTGMA